METSGDEQFLGILKGMRVVLEERGVNTRGMNTDKMQTEATLIIRTKKSLTMIGRYLMEEKCHVPRIHAPKISL